MAKQYIMDGASFIKLFMVKPDHALSVIENSYILEFCYAEIGDLLSNRSSMEETEDEKARISSMGEDLIDILKSVETAGVKWDNFKTMLNIAIYKKINFRDVAYLWSAKENNLILLTENDKLIKIGAELDIVVKNVDDI